MADRSPEIPAEQWWLDLARELLDEDKRQGRTLTELGIALAKHVGRERPFHHTMLSRFKAKEIGATIEFAEALACEFVNLPVAVLIPKTREEALALMHTASRYRSGRPPSPSSPAPVLPFEKPAKKHTAHQVAAPTAKTHSRK